MSFITKIDMNELHQIWIETGRDWGILKHIKLRSPS